MDVGSSGQPIQVAVKLAFSEAEKATLEHEHKIYSRLHSQGVRGIPHDFGLFVDDEVVDDEEGPYALIMSFAGDSLFRRESVSKAVKRSLLTTLKAIHRAGVVHGDVRLPNLCATATGEAFVIDFGHAKISTAQKVMADEVAEIRGLLSMDVAVRGNAAAPLGIEGLRRSSRIKQQQE